MKQNIKFQLEKIQINEEVENPTAKRGEEIKESDSKDNDKSKSTSQYDRLNLTWKNIDNELQSPSRIKIQI